MYVSKIWASLIFNKRARGSQKVSFPSKNPAMFIYRWQKLRIVKGLKRYVKLYK